MKKFDFKTMNFSDIPAFVKSFFEGDKNDNTMMRGHIVMYEVNFVQDLKMIIFKLKKCVT